MSGTLTCNFAERNSVLVITLAGSFQREALPQLLRMMTEIRVRKPRIVVINSCYLQRIDRVAHIALQEFFASIRRLCRLRFCFVPERLRDALTREALVQPQEIRETLIDAVL